MLFREGWVEPFSANFRCKGMSPPTIVTIRKLECFCYLKVWIEYERVTDGQRDGIAVANTALCITNYNQSGHTVKTGQAVHCPAQFTENVNNSRSRAVNFDSALSQSLVADTPTLACARC